MKESIQINQILRFVMAILPFKSASKQSQKIFNDSFNNVLTKTLNISFHYYAKWQCYVKMEDYPIFRNRSLFNAHIPFNDKSSTHTIIYLSSTTYTLFPLNFIIKFLYFYKNFLMYFDEGLKKKSALS